MSKAAVDLKFKAEGRCRLCLRPRSVRPLTRHRIIPAPLRGPYTPNNCVPLCRPCHELVDHWDSSIRDPARRMLRAVLWPAEIGYALARSSYWFDRWYPRPPRELVLDQRQALAAVGPAPRIVHGKDCHPVWGCVSSCPRAA